MRRRARQILLFSAVFLVWACIFEAALRRWGSSEAAPAFQGLFTSDPVLGYRLNPGAHTRFTTSEFDTTIHIAQAGVRDDEEIGSKPPGETRIAILGDSLVLSVQVPFSTTFAEQMERRLNDAAAGTGRSYRVINAGVQGYGPVEELLFFRRVVRQLQPDVVLVTVFVGNDAEEALGSQAKLSPDKGITERVREGVVTRLRRTVRRSMVLQILRLRVLAATERFRTAAGPPEAPLPAYAKNPSPRIEQGISLARDVLAQIANEANAAGAQTGIILMPARFQIDDGDYGRLRDIVAQSGGELMRDAATDRFAAALDDLELPTIDLLPVLRNAKHGSDLFFQENVHLTPRGHAVVGESLAAFVQAHFVAR
jgi:lysophospholipase L1-like esterase